MATDRMDEGGRLLVLNDYGVVHPDPVVRDDDLPWQGNGWLTVGESYDLLAGVPTRAVRFQLTPSADGRFWRCRPTIPKLLDSLGVAVPPALSNEKQAVLLVFPAPPQK